MEARVDVSMAAHTPNVCGHSSACKQNCTLNYFGEKTNVQLGSQLLQTTANCNENCQSCSVMHVFLRSK